jgi:MFS family permease
VWNDHFDASFKTFRVAVASDGYRADPGTSFRPFTFQHAPDIPMRICRARYDDKPIAERKQAMAPLTISAAQRDQANKRAAIVAVSTMIGVLFAGSTLLTPLYVIYKQQFGFSGIILTLIYAAYVVGNLGALLLFGRLSDQIGRRSTTLPALGIAAVSTIIFLFAESAGALFWGRALSGLGIGLAVGTGNAWLAELVGSDKARATLIATGANFLGLALGPLIAGLFAEYAPWPLHLSFVVYLAALVVVAGLIGGTEETVARRAHGFGDISLRPRIGVPAAIRGKFIAPAVAGFGAMALVGFFAALAPSILAQELNEPSHAAAGALVFELAIVCAVTVLLTQSLSSHTAMQWGLGLMVPSVGLIVASQLLASTMVMIVATAVCGVSAGLGYRGSLQVINKIAPEDRRAEVTSSYFVCCFVGNALPVIGVGIISAYAGMPIASATFAGVISVFAVAALIFDITHTR